MSRQSPIDLFADPGARVVWAAICEFEEGDQHEVLKHLRDRLAAADIRETPQQRRVARATAALREAADELGCSPSIKDFERLRVDHPEWPPAGSIRGWLGGSWSRCLERARLDRIVVGDAIGVDVGRFTEKNVKEAVLEAARDLGDDDVARAPTFMAYLSWPARRRCAAAPVAGLARRSRLIATAAT